MNPLNRPEAQLWSALGELLVKAAEEAQLQVRKAYRKNAPKRTAARRKPGPTTPLWNVVAGQLNTELQDYGAKSRLARFLGVPPQRVTDWLRGHRRLPDAETLLQILYFLNERRAGQDPTI